MSDWIDSFIFYEEVSSDELNALSESFDAADIAQAFEEWKELRSEIRGTIEDAVKDRHLLIQFSLWRNGHVDALAPAELAEVELYKAHYEKALRTSPALNIILDGIQTEQDDFEEAWRLHVAPETPEISVENSSDTAGWRPMTSAGRPYLRAAAVVAILALGALFYRDFVEDRETVIVKAEGSNIESVQLEDGSTVRLIAGAELRYERTTSTHPFDRKVSLTGKALFTIRPGNDVFVVETPAAITTVWGTTFGLDSDDSFTEVVLAEGRVSVVSRRDSQRPVVLEPGQMTRVVGEREPTEPVRVNVADALAWTRLFVFRNEKTERIADRLTEHFGTPVRIDDALQHETVTGTFEQEWSLEYILEALSQTLDADVVGSTREGFDIRPSDASDQAVN